MRDNDILDEQVYKKKKKFPFWGYMTIVLLTILINAVLIFELFYITKYAALSHKMFMMINYCGVAALLLMDLLIFMTVKEKKTVLIIISCILIVIAGAGSGVAGVALAKLDSTVDKITATDYSVSVSTSLVTYANSSGDPIVTVDDLGGHVVGVAKGTDTETMGKDYLAESKIQPAYKEYTDYYSLIKGLLTDEVSCAILPSNYANLMNNDEQLQSYTEDTSVLHTFTKDVQATGVSGANKDLTKEPFTVLVTGENEGLADTIILVSVNPVSMDITMTSIARDSYVPITCYGGGKSKINASHVVSEACTVETVTQLTNIPVDYTVEFNFASVIEVVDAVGGVDVANEMPFYGQSWNVETDSLDVIPIPFDESGGIVHMNGKEALGFVRERHAFPDGDFARQRHQQAVIQNLITKVMTSKDPNTYLKILDAAGANIKTNITAEQMVQFIGYAMKKAERYYDPKNLAGIFNITSNRITGYGRMIWDGSLGMDIYTYQLYEGALADAKTVVDNNTNMSLTPSDPPAVSWNAKDKYTKPITIQEYYEVFGEPQDSGSGGTGYQDEIVDPNYDEPVNNIPQPVLPPQNEPELTPQTGEPVQPAPLPSATPVPAPQPPVPEQPVDPAPQPDQNGGSDGNGGQVTPEGNVQS